MAPSFDAYLALGDSISIDLYPAHDAERRYPGQASTDRLGAVSLLYRNDDRFWPAFRGRDLHSLQPALRFDPDRDDLTADGATTHSLLRQVERIERNDEPTLVTITAGGNDLLGQIGSAGDPVSAIVQRLQTSVGRLFELRPNATVLLGTVYDPSDGTNRLPGYGRTLDREAEWLTRYNDEVRRFVTTDSRLLLADIHRHFLGHGMTVPERDRWYLQESIIEPSARGASEVRRVWLEALGL
jgi:lysophospholipase L1-like esterase